MKADFNISDRFGFMFGVFNEFDSYVNTGNGLDLGAQVYFLPVTGWDVYLNFVTSDDSGTEIDITTTYTPNDNLLIGFNAARRTRGNYFVEQEGDGINFTGAALYLNYNFSDAWGLGFRGEHFVDTNGEVLGTGIESSVNALTLSANIGSGPLKLIPEIRTDIASEDIFVDSKDAATNSAIQFLIAAVYAF